MTWCCVPMKVHGQLNNVLYFLFFFFWLCFTFYLKMFLTETSPDLGELSATNVEICMMLKAVAVKILYDVIAYCDGTSVFIRLLSDGMYYGTALLVCTSILSFVYLGFSVD